MWLRTVSMLRFSSRASPRWDLLDVRDLPEHADDVIAAHEGNRAQVDAEPVTVGADQNDLRIPRPVWACDVAREDLA
jgi:hypothetical protein